MFLFSIRNMIIRQEFSSHRAQVRGGPVAALTIYTKRAGLITVIREFFVVTPAYGTDR